MQRILILVLTLSCTVRAMERKAVELPQAFQRLEQELGEDFADAYPRGLICCGLLHRTEFPRNILSEPAAIAHLSIAYNQHLETRALSTDGANIAAVIASMQRVNDIINEKTLHLQGPAAHASRIGWICSLLEHLPASAHTQTILSRFPEHTGTTNGVHYVRRLHLLK